MLEQAHTSSSDTIPASAGLEEEGGGEGVCYILYMHPSILIPRILLHTGSEQMPDASNALGTRLLQIRAITNLLE